VPGDHLGEVQDTFDVEFLEPGIAKVKGEPDDT